MTGTPQQGRGSDREFFVGLARAFAGAIVFALPMLMTMEMWWIGVYVHPGKLAVLTVVLIPLLVGLARFGGFKPTGGLRDDLVDAFVAIAVGIVTSSSILFILGLITPDLPADELVGRIVIQLLPASIGAMLARNQLRDEEIDPEDAEDEAKQRPQSYWGEIFLMAVGALFLSLNVAPTEEVVLLSYSMGPLPMIALVLVSLVAMHSFVYAADFPGAPEPGGSATFWSLFLRFTIVGYAVVLLISFYILWTFGRTTGTGLDVVLGAAVILGFPSAIGAAAARLIL